MIGVVINGATYEEVESQMKQAVSYADVDLMEWRLDYLTLLDLPSIKRLLTKFSKPLIFTLRSPSQGGHYKKSENDRLNDLQKLADLKPHYLDLEYDISPDSPQTNLRATSRHQINPLLS